MKLAKGDKVAIVCCSNGKKSVKEKGDRELKSDFRRNEPYSCIFKIYLSKDFFREVENNLKGFQKAEVH